MPDDPRSYESEIVRVRSRSGTRWGIVGVGGALLVLAVGIGGTLLAPSVARPVVAAIDPPTGPVEASAAAAPSTGTDRGRAAAATRQRDITKGPSGYDAVFEAWWTGIPRTGSTDSSPTRGGADYGIGWRLLRALEPTPAPPAP